MSYPLKNCQAGFTLLEIILTIILMSFSAMIILPIIQAMTTVTTPAQRQQAVTLGQGLMDEILCKRWDENTPVGGAPILSPETAIGSRGVGTWPLGTSPSASAIIGPDGAEARATFDDVDDYHGFSEADDFNDQTGGNEVNMPNFSRTVTVRYISSSLATITASSPAAIGATDTKCIVVTVTAPTGETFDFVALACNF